MKRAALMVLMVLLVIPWLSVQAQDGGKGCESEQLKAALDSAIGQLQVARETNVSEALTAIMEVETQLHLLADECRGNQAGDFGSRVNPVPVGEYFEFGGGQVRITAVVDPADPADFYGLDPGMRVIAIEMEYVCQQTDPNASCSSLDAIPSDIVTPAGMVIDSQFVIQAGDQYLPEWAGQEAFGGNTLKGYDFIVISDDQAVESIRLLINFDYVFFSPMGASG